MKKVILIILFSIFLLGLTGYGLVDAADERIPTIVEDYPKLPACEDNAECMPGDPGFGLPQFINYIFIFSLGIVGMVGLIAMIIGGFGYMTSTGNPQKAAQAKDKIISALLGLLLLLGSYVLLSIINPDLLKLKLEAEPVIVEIEDGDEEQCLPLYVSWEKPKINVGEATYLVFTLNEYCAGEEDNVEVKIASDCRARFLRQDRPADNKDIDIGWDPYCTKVYYTGIQKVDHNKKGLILLKYEYKFKGECRDKVGLSECIFKHRGIICNFRKDSAEKFYVTGNCEMQDGTFFSVPKLYITVEDNK